MMEENEILDRIRMEEKEILDRIRKARDELKVLSDDDYWWYTKEYWNGLLDSCVLSLDKILEDLE